MIDNENNLNISITFCQWKVSTKSNSSCVRCLFWPLKVKKFHLMKIRKSLTIFCFLASPTMLLMIWCKMSWIDAASSGINSCTQFKSGTQEYGTQLAGVFVRCRNRFGDNRKELEMQKQRERCRNRFGDNRNERKMEKVDVVHKLLMSLLSPKSWREPLTPHNMRNNFHPKIAFDEFRYIVSHATFVFIGYVGRQRRYWPLLPITTLVLAPLPTPIYTKPLSTDLPPSQETSTYYTLRILNCTYMYHHPRLGTVAYSNLYQTTLHPLLTNWLLYNSEPAHIIQPILYTHVCNQPETAFVAITILVLPAAPTSIYIPTYPTTPPHFTLPSSPQSITYRTQTHKIQRFLLKWCWFEQEWCSGDNFAQPRTFYHAAFSHCCFSHALLFIQGLCILHS